MLINHVEKFFRESHIVYVINDAPVITCMISHPFLEIAERHILLFCLAEQFLHFMMGHKCV
jgi:hypothetical protein